MADTMASERASTWSFLTRLILVVLLVGLFGRAYIFDTFFVEGDSMNGTLLCGDRVLVNRFIYHLRGPERGEVVVFRLDDGPQTLVKRILATAGEIVEMKEGVVYVNGRSLPEQYLTHRGEDSFSPVKVPTGSVFVLGDNRPTSEDSRAFGPVPMSRVSGSVMLVFWPPSSFSMMEMTRRATVNP